MSFFGWKFFKQKFCSICIPTSHSMHWWVYGWAGLITALLLSRLCVPGQAAGWAGSVSACKCCYRGWRWRGGCCDYWWWYPHLPRPAGPDLSVAPACTASTPARLLSSRPVPPAAGRAARLSGRGARHGEGRQAAANKQKLCRKVQ